MRTRPLLLASSLAAAIALSTNAPVSGQTYPTKPGRIVVTAAPGGGVDIMARLLGREFAQSLGQQFIVENRTPSVAGADFVAKSQPDGYTLMLTTATYLVNGALRKDLPYDPLRDFAPVSLIGATPIIICVHPSLQVTDVKGLIALAKRRKGELNFGSGGIGSPLHLAGELFKQDAKVDIVHVAYKGTAPAAYDLLAGQVQVMFPSVISMYPYIQAGKVRVLAVMSPRHTATLPKVQTTAEAGLPDLVASIWFGLVAPKNTSPQVVGQLHQAVVKAIAAKEFRERLVRDEVEAIGNTPQEFAAFAQAEYTKWARVIKAANIKVE